MRELMRLSHITNHKEIKDFNMDVQVGELMVLLGEYTSGKEFIKDIITG